MIGASCDSTFPGPTLLGQSPDNRTICGVAGEAQQAEADAANGNGNAQSELHNVYSDAQAVAFQVPPSNDALHQDVNSMMADAQFLAGDTNVKGDTFHLTNLMSDAESTKADAHC